MKKIIYNLRVLLVAFCCLFGISLFYINSSTLCNMVVKALNLHVDPKFVGGEVAAEYFIESELVRYTVHQPVYNARWQQNADYWQIDLEFEEGESVSQREVEVYLEIPKASVVVKLQGGAGKVYDSERGFICDAEVSLNDNGKSMWFRIPLKDKQLQSVYTAAETSHSVPAANFMAIVDMKAVAKSNEKEDKVFVDGVVAKLLEYEAAEGKEDSESAGGEYFGFEKLDDALAHFENQIKENPEEAIPTAYYGSCLAMKGGQSNVMQAVTLVNKAFEYMDLAVELCKNDEELVEVLMNRASVCKSVPEAVFNKALTGAEDYKKLAAIQKASMKEEGLENNEHEKYVLSYLYINASQCYKSAGKDTEAKLILQEAKKAVK